MKLGMMFAMVTMAMVGGCSSSSTSAPVATDHCGTRTCGSDGFGGSCGDCVAPETCSAAGACEAPSASPCSALVPNGTCPSGEACVAGSCCASAQSCPGVCCKTGAACVTDLTGNKSCAVVCKKNSDCPTASGCCTALTNGTGACEPNGLSSAQRCLCASAGDCTSKSCGEETVSGNPIGSPVCVPNDGAPYHGCNNGVACASGYCCLAVGGADNHVCVEGCHDNTQCGGRTCKTITTAGVTCGGLPGGCW